MSDPWPEHKRGCWIRDGGECNCPGTGTHRGLFISSAEGPRFGPSIGLIPTAGRRAAAIRSLLADCTREEA